MLANVLCPLARGSCWHKHVPIGSEPEPPGALAVALSAFGNYRPLSLSPKLETLNP